MPENAAEPQSNWWKRDADSIYLTLTGVLLLLVAWATAKDGAEAASATLALMGGGALILAPFAGRIQGRLKLGPLEVVIRDRFIQAARFAPLEDLQAILPLVETEDLVVREVVLPRALANHALVDPKLQFIRRDLGLSVVAVRLPGNARWQAGGAVSETKLPAGSLLLVAGRPESVRQLINLGSAELTPEA